MSASGTLLLALILLLAIFGLSWLNLGGMAKVDDGVTTSASYASLTLSCIPKHLFIQVIQTSSGTPFAFASIEQMGSFVIDGHQWAADRNGVADLGHGYCAGDVLNGIVAGNSDTLTGLLRNQDCGYCGSASRQIVIPNKTITYDGVEGYFLKYNYSGWQK